MILSEEFVRHIATAPDDDFVRLEAADWLERHGDVCRADFIRAQLRADGSACGRAVEAYEAGGQDWARAFLTPLSLDTAELGFEHYSNSWRSSAYAHVTVRLRDLSSQVWAAVPELCYQRGFVHDLRLSLRPGQQLCEALRVEPIEGLTLNLERGRDFSSWSDCTGVEIQRIRRLQLEFCQGQPVDLGPLLSDPNWTGLKELHLSCWPAVPQLATAPLQREILRQLADSAWSRQLRKLEVWDPDEDGLADLQLERWSLQEFVVKA